MWVPPPGGARLPARAERRLPETDRKDTVSYQFSLCSEVFETPIEDTMRQVARLGFDGIEIAPFNIAERPEDVSRERRADLRRLAEDLGLRIVGLHWLLVTPFELHLTGPDVELRRRTVGHLRSLAALCGDLGGSVMVLGSPKQRSIEPGTTPEQAFDRARDALREVGQACEGHGVRLLFEALAPAETNFVNTIEEAKRLVAAVDHPAIGYMLDCKAMSSMPEGILGTITAHGRDAGHVHTNEATGKGPGMGELDFAPILRALDASGFEGWVSTEPFVYEPDRETVARVALETLRAARARASREP